MKGCSIFTKQPFIRTKQPFILAISIVLISNTGILKIKRASECSQALLVVII
ncbi:MAG: hypothetical protein LBL74_07160 [Bacteroidales bacterium]|nr:hypothetical protein [Bacteroidales bacterium]